MNVILSDSILGKATFLALSNALRMISSVLTSLPIGKYTPKVLEIRKWQEFITLSWISLLFSETSVDEIISRLFSIVFLIFSCSFRDFEWQIVTVAPLSASKHANGLPTRLLLLMIVASIPVTPIL